MDTVPQSVARWTRHGVSTCPTCRGAGPDGCEGCGGWGALCRHRRRRGTLGPRPRCGGRLILGRDSDKILCLDCGAVVGVAVDPPDVPSGGRGG